MPSHIVYQDGYKYQLQQDYAIQLRHFVDGQDFNREFISMDKYGCLCVHEGYAWDGPSGPTIDTKDFMRGSLVHDALYQILRETGRHHHERLRLAADRELHRIILEDGMSRLRAWYVYRAVRWFGAPAARGQRTMVVAP